MDRHFTKEEAQQIFATAAERQQANKRPENALTLAELEEAGRAAGIESDYIRAAAAHLLSPEKSSVVQKVAGVPIEMRKSRRFNGDISDDDWGTIVLELRKLFKKNGVVSELGSLREWASVADDQKMPYRVVVEPEEGGTRVTFERKTWHRALGLGIGAGVNLIMGLIILVVSITAGADGDQFIPGMILTLFGLLFASSAYFGLRYQGRSDARRFDEAFDRIAQILGTPARAPRQKTVTRAPLADALESAEAYGEASPADRKNRSSQRHSRG